MDNSLEIYGISKDWFQDTLRDSLGINNLELRGYSARIISTRYDSEKDRRHDTHLVRVSYRGYPRLPNNYILKSSFHEGEDTVYSTGLSYFPEKIALKSLPVANIGSTRALITEFISNKTLDDILGEEGFSTGDARDTARISVYATAYAHKRLGELLRNPNIKRFTFNDYLKKHVKYVMEMIEGREKETGKRTFSSEREKKEYELELRREFEPIAQCFEHGTASQRKEWIGIMNGIGHTDLHARHIMSKKFDSNERVERIEDITAIDPQPAIVPKYFDLVDLIYDPKVIHKCRFTDGEIIEILMNSLKIDIERDSILKTRTKFFGFFPGFFSTTERVLSEEFMQDALLMFHLAGLFRCERAASKPFLMMQRLSESGISAYEEILKTNPSYKYYARTALNNALDSAEKAIRLDPRRDVVNGLENTLRLLGDKIEEFGPDYPRGVMNLFKGNPNSRNIEEHCTNCPIDKK